MRRAICRAIALALLLGLAPPTGAESPAPDRLRGAYESGRRVEADLRLELDGGLYPLLGMTEEEYAQVRALVEDCLLTVYAVKRDDGPELGFALSIAGEPILDGRVWRGSGALWIGTSLLPGETLRLDDEALIRALDEQLQPHELAWADLRAIDARKYFRVVWDWSMAIPNFLEEIGRDLPGSQHRDEAKTAYAVRVSPEQLKRLLVMLAEEFARDEALKKIASLFIAPDELEGLDVGDATVANARLLRPAGGEMEWKIYCGDRPHSTEMVGVTGSVTPMFEGTDSEFGLGYGRVQGMQWFELALWEGDGGEMTLEMEAADGALSVRLRQVEYPGAPQSEWKLASKRVQMADGDGEALEGRVTARQWSGPTGAANDGTARPMGDPGGWATADLAFTWEARAAGEEDVAASASLDATFMDVRWGRAVVALRTADHAPPDTSGHEIVILDALSDESNAALTARLQTGFTRAMLRAAGAMPPGLLGMMADAPDADLIGKSTLVEENNDAVEAKVG